MHVPGIRHVLPWLFGVASAATNLPAQQPADRLTLPALYRAVDSLSPRIAAARSEAAAAQARVSGARRLPDPWLELGTMNRDLPGFELNDPLGMNQVMLTQMVPIPGTGKLGLAGTVAQSRADARGAEAVESAWEQRSRAAMAFYDLYQATATREAMRETLRLLDGVARTVAGMYAVGEATQADVLRAQLETGRMTGQLAEMEAMQTTMTARLNAVLNRRPDAPTGSPELPPFPDSLPPADSLEARALTGRGVVLAATQEVAAATAAETLAHREIWPDLELGVAYGWQPMDTGTMSMLSLTLGASLPIWAGSRQLKMRDETTAMRQAAQDNLMAQQSDTRAQVAALVTEAHRAATLGALYRGTLIPQSEATVAAARAAYQVGAVDFMTYLDALMTVYANRATLFRLEADRGKALAELEVLVATPLVAAAERGAPTTGGTP